MFFPSDTTTEIVAHFLGYFEMRIEEMRLRLSYEEFASKSALEATDPGLEQIPVEILQEFKLGAYQPGVFYAPPSWDIRGEAPVEGAVTALPIWNPAELPWLAWPADLPGELGDVEGEDAPLIGDEPGSVIAIISQQLSLSDNDVAILGNYSGPIIFESGAAAGIDALYSAATAVGAPVSSISALNSVADAALFVTETAKVIDALETSGDPQTTVVLTEAIEGTYVNGEVVAEIPDLLTALPEQLREDVDEEQTEESAADGAVSEATVTIYGRDVVDSVTLESGANLLVNEAAFLNAGMTSTFLAVGGDYYQLDAIIQTNAFFDIDTIDEGFPGASGNAGIATIAYNVATFEQEVRDSASTAAAANQGAMPLNWQVSVVTGDVVFIEWLSQFTFSSDEDVHVLSSTGTTTTVTTGENVGINGVSFGNIGLYYDLIIIGGNLYDANIIVQTNVLYDNDTLELLTASDRGDGELSTSGNLLWNQASILNVGATEFQSGIPAHYQRAAEGLANGDNRMPEGFETDSQFEGFYMVRVLYVAGDVYDLRYVQQTNVLGDADYVAIQEAQLLEDNPDTAWDISTGSNALINVATIQDYDSVGDTAYVGGEIYSDAILIQADIVAANPDNPSGDALVTEVIAFLETDAVVDTSPDDIGPDHAPADGPPVDIMQSMLA